ncbi:hypothetical protein H4582DRAFT_2078351 [Lactarius indigo]|nr:hypothetical protein H4582DRAFT_2078351 [Lactarius indigo]
MFDFGEDNYDDDLDMAEDTPPGLFPLGLDTVSNCDDEDEDRFAPGIQCMPQPSLRSRPPIDFSGLHPSMAPSFLRKTSLNSAPPARLPLNAIVALTDSELLHNPHHRKLRWDHNHLASGEGLVPDIYQAVPRSVNSCRADSRGADSHALSLGPSDSASQQTRPNAIENLLERVEPPSLRPQFLLKSVLWDFEDCEDDKSQGDIVMKKNRSRPKMKIIIQRLINFVNLDPQSAVHAGGPKARTKTFIKKYFTVKYYQAMLDLEAEQKLLHLCSAHWKADALITQVFLRQNDVKVGAVMNSAHATSPQSNHPLELLTVLIPQIQEVVPMNTVKWALELSPGPKSPTALHTQKRSKDNSAPDEQHT